MAFEVAARNLKDWYILDRQKHAGLKERPSSAVASRVHFIGSHTKRDDCQSEDKASSGKRLQDVEIQQK